MKSKTTDRKCNIVILSFLIGRRFAAALLPRLFGTNPRSHHKGATGRVRTGNQRLPVLCHCQLGQDIPLKIDVLINDFKILKLYNTVMADYVAYINDFNSK